jgi:peptidyl-prolyl cis-trans isomerase B (cyclophilin B)
MQKTFLIALFLTFSLASFAQKGVKTPVKKPVASKAAAAPKAPAKPAVPIKKTQKDSLNLKGPERVAEITTDQGVMIVKLYNETPLHRDNFIKLVKQGFYDSLLFHRVIEGFMIQGGDPNSRNAGDGVPLGNGSAPGERIPAEFNNKFYHKKGALAAARDGNPEKASSNCQFYIVHGKKYEAQELQTNLGRVQGSNPTFTWTAAQQEVYQRIGGAPFLDQGYTVYGEVISGLEVIDKIAALPRGAGDRPIQNSRMKIRMLN